MKQKTRRGKPNNKKSHDKIIGKNAKTTIFLCSLLHWRLSV